MMLIDTHCHIDRFPDPLAVSRECEEQRIFTVAVSNLPSHYELAMQHLAKMQYVKPALGFHPLSVEHNFDELSLFESLLPDVQFIGEVGLDYSRQGINSKESQLKVFRYIAHLLSQEARFVTIHSRRAAADVLEILDDAKLSNAVFHWYSDSMTLLRKIADAGHYFSINPAMILSKLGQAVINSVPRDQILTETDGPYVKAGTKPAKPIDVNRVLNAISSHWGVDVERVEEQVANNFSSLCNALTIRLPCLKN